ncbi:bifunctional folylpolyglutamate synthase/dihydrofolate synthase [Hydrogenimonas urashimensis]|uniref:bifunctional folylpolyglutamate synthase/dihydrofolate synthase n=1 Tax=Hydrogenimonas urashimensis TaxID=2740515 RepID=UPI00191611B2|nr:bifunctional folylpolyglutamate synthase/dihydrofolate synthase [Hydrogenimonas urashimensis]
MEQNLSDFLATKPLYYDRIDLARMPGAFREVESHLRLGTVVHLVGTNAKGSTGRMLATMLRQKGAHVGHYSSPHIVKFNERIWIDGKDADDATLQRAHRKLMKWLAPERAETLSYFEYTTLLALVAFESLEFIVLEAGLGGEFDATSVVPNSLTVVTPVGIDHQAFLGETIEEIAATKIRSVQKRLLLAPQTDPLVCRVAEEIASKKGVALFRARTLCNATCRHEIKKVAKKCGWPDFYRENAMTAAAAYTLLTRDPVPWEALAAVRMRGRFERIAPNVVLDVGHNLLGARRVAEALDGKKVVLVYNALSDKDAEAILKTLKPVVKRLEIIAIESDRAMAPEKLAEAASHAGLDVSRFRGVTPTENYLVFGSFLVAEAFLKRFEV